MRFQQFLLTEASLSTSKLDKVLDLIVGSLEKKVGQKFWRFGKKVQSQYFLVRVKIS